METCLVSGGAGFIGSWLCEYLLREYRIICIDDLSSGNEKNILVLKKNKNFKFFKHNIIKKLKISGKINYVFHLASRASPIDYQTYPIHTMLTNSFGTYNMLNLAKEKKARFLFSSTSEVYGDPVEHPQKESYYGNVNPIGIRACYDESKRFSEALTMTFMREFSVDVRIVRIFNTYGPRMKEDDGRVISNFITQALKGKEITVYGNGSQTRSFCYISDMVEGITKAMFSDKASGEVINLGNPNEFKILELAKLVRKLTNSRSKIIFRDLPEDDPKRRCPNIDKARRLLNWKPKVSLEEGLKKTIQYFKNEFNM
ncbi:MAG: UDP-glucuronic acid decarboxylase family protein [Candidatus Altiarchaeota archaeon]